MTLPLETEDKPLQADKDTKSYVGSGAGWGGDGSPPPDIDPIIKGLISRLPPADSQWPKAKRKLWLQILDNSFDLVYEDAAAKRDNDDLI